MLSAGGVQMYRSLWMPCFHLSIKGVELLSNTTGKGIKRTTEDEHRAMFRQNIII